MIYLRNVYHQMTLMEREVYYTRLNSVSKTKMKIHLLSVELIHLKLYTSAIRLFQATLIHDKSKYLINVIYDIHFLIKCILFQSINIWVF